jgi:uncharacterized protein (UPF0276 family)
MRRFALGCLKYTPERFGLMLVGDFLDAVTGYREGENEKLKDTAELIRSSTTILLNIHLAKEDKVTAHELWPFPWDKEADIKIEVISQQEKERREAKMKEILNKITSHGNSNIKP